MKLIVGSVLITAVLVFAQTGTSPIVTGGFAQNGPTATLILLNQSSLDDATLAKMAVALNLRTANVAIATRLAGSSYCAAGEWCLAITDNLSGYSGEAAGAIVGTEVTKEIGRKILQ